MTSPSDPDVVGELRARAAVGVPMMSLDAAAVRAAGRRRLAVRRWVAGGGAVAAALVLAVVATTAGAFRPTEGITPVGTTSSPVVTTTSTTTTPTAAGCQDGQIAVTLLGNGAAAGTVGQVIGFANVSQSACTLEGYPGVAALDSQGRQVAQARPGLTGSDSVWNPADTPPVVTLEPGETASAMVQGGDTPIGNATSCTYYPFLLVTPPGLTASKRVAPTMAGSTIAGFPGCVAIWVDPVVPGNTGRLSATPTPSPVVTSTGPVPASCSTASLALGYGQPVAPATGEHAIMYTLTNNASTPCLLFGYPTVGLYDSAGQVLAFHYDHTPSQYLTSDPPANVVLAPGGTGYFLVAKYRCDAGALSDAATIRIDLPDQSQPLNGPVAPADGALPSLSYCQGGANDPGQDIAVSPFEATETGALAH